MEKPRTARLLHQLLVLYQRVALYFRSPLLPLKGEISFKIFLFSSISGAERKNLGDSKVCDLAA